MSVGSEAKAVQERSALNATLVPNAGYARLWKLMAGIFLLAGLLALLERVWVLTADVHARRTWPVAPGVIVSAQQQDDAEMPGRLRGHTRYWVEYEVRFAVPAGECRTGIIYEGAAEPMPCGGIVRTRSTQSTAEVYQWFVHGYHPNEPVKVLWNPEGAASSDIKIAGESIWIRYNFGRLIFSLVWVLGFGSLYVYCKRQVSYFGSHPEEERPSQPSTPPGVVRDNDQLTDLDLS